jgi:SnoaL-like domain
MSAAQASIAANLHTAMERWYKGDPFGYADLFMATITYVDPFAPAVIVDSGTLRRHYQRFNGKVFRPRFEIQDTRVIDFGAAHLCVYRLQSWQADGTADKCWNATELYQRSGDTWRIAFAHWSLPADN